MRKRSDSLRKTLAFTAALALVSSSFSGLPVDYTATVHADGNELLDGNTTKNTYKIEISNEDIDEAFSWVGFDNFVTAAFDGYDITIDHINRTISSELPVSDPAKSLYFGDKLYKLNSNMGGIITYDAYTKIHDNLGGDRRVSLTFDNFCHTDDGYCKLGSPVYITPERMYSCNNSDILARITNNSVLSFDICDEKNDSFTVNVTDVDGESVFSCDISPKTYNIETDSSLSVLFDGKKVSGDKLKWCDIARVSVDAKDVQALVISDGINTRTVTPDELPYYFFHAFETQTLQSHISDITYHIEAVTNAVKPNVTIDGENADDRIQLIPIEKDSKGYYITVPYILGTDCYLSGYTYDNNVEISASEVYDSLVADKQYLRLKYIPDKDIKLNFTKFATSDKANYTINGSFQQKNDCCYMTNSLIKGEELLSFSDDTNNSLLILNHLDLTGGKYALTADSMQINAENRQFIPDSRKYSNAKYIAVKDIISFNEDANKLVNLIDNTIYFMTDSTSPDITISDNEHMSDGKWINKNDAYFTLKFNDELINPVDELSQSLSAQDTEIAEAFSKIFGSNSEFSDISSISIGSFTFDIPMEKVSGTIEGRYESVFYRNARNALAEAIMRVRASRINSSFSDSKRSVIALASDPETLGNALDNAENVSENDLKELRRLLNNLKVQNNKNTLDYTITLTYNDKSNDYTVAIVPNNKEFTDTIEDNLTIYAEDFSGNVSETFTQRFRIDSSLPEISKSRINVIDPVANTDNFELILGQGSIIEVIPNDIGSGIDKIMFSVGGEPDTEFQNMGDGVYRHLITQADIDGKNICAPINVLAIDNAGNRSEVVSSRYKVILDSTPPENALSRISEPSYSSMGTDWYGGYSSLSYRISADDTAAEVNSGLAGIEITINDHVTSLDVSSSGLNKKCLSEGKYYVAFEPVENSDGFRAVLRRSDYPEYSNILYETADNPDGRIRINFNSFDLVGNKGEKVSDSVVVDTHKPHIVTISADGKNLISSADSINYSVFSDKALKAEISASDALPSSGIKSIIVTLMNENGTKHSSMTYPTDGNMAVPKVYADIPLNFKGYIIAEAVDNSGLVSDAVTSLGIVTEDSAMHKDTSDISIILPETQFTDIFGHPLYKSDVTAHVSVSDSFSEIAKAELRASGLPTQSVIINPDGTLSGDSAESWNFENDGNLVCSISRDIKVTKNGNSNKIELNMWDNVGLNGEPTSESAEFSIDRNTPKVKIAFSNGADINERQIFSSDISVIVIVNERNFSPALATVKVNGTKRDVNWYLASGEEGTDSAEYRAEIPFSADGNYRVEAQVKDLCDWESPKVFTNSFIIDRTPPEVRPPASMSSAPNQTYSEPFSAVFNVVDNNFNADNIVIKGTLDNKAEDFPKNSKWVKSGDHHSTTIDFEKDGEYTINISGKDSAGNELPEYDNSFRIDSENPFIDIQDVSKANNGDVIQPRLIYTDRFLDKDSITIKVDGAKRGKDLKYSGKFVQIDNGWEFIFDNLPNSKEYDDIYTISTSVKDAAGNSAMDEFQFSVNRFGSTFMLSDKSAEIPGKILSDVPDVTIKEVNVDRHTDSYSVIIKKDNHNIELQPEADFTISNTSPEPNSWSEYTYVIPDTLFNDEAKYNISVHSVDRAGNINNSESAYDFSFTVDKTPPVLTKTDIESNKVYKGKSHKFNIEFTDNTEISDVTVTVDGYVATREFADGKCTFELPKSNQPQLVTVELIDMAGNKTELKYNNVLVTNNLFKYTSHQSWFRIIFGTIGAGVVGAGAFVFCKIRKKKNNLW
ncbi:MAG: hypothetical protein MJ100_08000 [Ruminococcus sp.]|nr:hypothetical protein [Ruminococcus sp.]